MEEEKYSSSSAVLPKIDIRKLDFEEGEDANTVWQADLKIAICGAREGLVKSMLYSIVTSGLCYAPTWPTEESTREKYPLITEKRQRDLIMKKLEEKAAYETTHLDDAKGTAHSLLLGLMAKTSIDVLLVDLEYKENSRRVTPDPSVTYSRIYATHILQRNGKDLQRTVVNKTKLLHSFMELKQGSGKEHIVDYLERSDRAVRALKIAGVDIKLIYKTDEELIIKFIYGLCPNRYGGFIRDVSNKLVPIPLTFAEVITLAKDRKELTGTSRARVDSTVLLTKVEEKASDNHNPNQNVLITICGKPEIGPLEPYSRMHADEWAKLSRQERSAIIAHNRAIDAAASSLAKIRGAKDSPKAGSGRFKGRREKEESTTKKEEVVGENIKSVSFLTKMQEADENGLVLMTQGDAVVDITSPPKRTGKKWYSVRKGRITGIFQHWEGPGQAKEQVMRFNGAEHKSFRTEIEASQWMNIGRTELCDSDDDEPPPLIESDSDDDDDEDTFRLGAASLSESETSSPSVIDPATIPGPFTNAKATVGTPDIKELNNFTTELKRQRAEQTEKHKKALEALREVSSGMAEKLVEEISQLGKEHERRLKAELEQQRDELTDSHAKALEALREVSTGIAVSAAEERRMILEKRLISKHESKDIVLATTGETNDTFKENQIILDCASGVNLCKTQKYASNIRTCQPGTISGITGNGGKESTYYESCNLLDDNLGRIPLLPSAAANIISMAAARDKGFAISYDNDSDSFTLLSPSGCSYKFGRRKENGTSKGKFYVLEILPVIEHTCLTKNESGIPSVAAGKDKYTVRENQAAIKAKGFIATMGYPPIQVALQQARTMRNCPVTDGDIKRAFEIYGPSLAAIKGSTKQTRTAAADIEIGVPTVQVEQSGEVDMMFVRGNVFLICIVSPLEYSFLVPLKDRSTSEVYQALEAILSAARAKGFDVRWIRSDNEGAMAKTEVVQMLQDRGASVDKVAPGKHASKAERRIQFIKQKLRTIKAGLPYNMSKQMSKHATLAANRFTNMQKATSSTSDLTPREKFLGRAFDYNKDGGIQFGTYVQATVTETDSSDKPRTESCIALYPKDSNTPTMYVLRIKGQRVVARSNLKIMPIPDVVVKLMDEDAEYDGLGSAYPEEHVESESHVESDAPDTTDGNEMKTNFQPVNAQSRELSTPQTAIKTVHQNDNIHEIRGAGIAHPINDKFSPEHNDDYTNGTDATIITVDNVEQNTTETSPEPKKSTTDQAARRSARLAYEEEYPYFKPTDNILMTVCNEHNLQYALNMTSKQAVQKLGDDASESIKAELAQLVAMKTFTPVRLTLDEQRKKGAFIKSKMFVKEKLLPNGDIDKIKSRLVGRGDMQAREDYGDEDLSATTSDLSSVLIASGIAAHEHRKVATLDFTSAYLNASMDPNAPQVVMKVDATCTSCLIAIDPSYSEYVTKSGEVFVKLNRCLYGCIESAKRWQNHLTGTLTSLGFTSNPQDTCVFNMIGASGHQITIVVYVDDLLITCISHLDIETVVNGLKKVYPQVKHEIGTVHNYLGMTIDFTVSGTASITMDGMVRDIVATSGTKDLDKKSSSPTRDNLFTIDPDEEPVAEPDRQTFHSTVQKTAYVAKRVRPECLAAISFLQTRVTKATPSDIYKLDQVIRYLHQSPNRGIRIKPGAAGIVIRTFADSSYGVHWDGKSHSGLCIHLGDHGCVHASSKRQTIVTKSSTEAELVCASDSGNQVLHLRQFLINQGYPPMPAVMFQDNMSTIALIEKGMSTSTRSRHINVRYFWLRERIDEQEISIVHIGTKCMGSANILTKPVMGAQFEEERMQLTNW